MCGSLILVRVRKQLQEKEDKEMKNTNCVFCEGDIADFIWLDGAGGQWRVCDGCIKEGKTDTEALNV